MGPNNYQGISALVVFIPSQSACSVNNFLLKELQTLRLFHEIADNFRSTAGVVCIELAIINHNNAKAALA